MRKCEKIWIFIALSSFAISSIYDLNIVYVAEPTTSIIVEETCGTNAEGGFYNGYV